jgi:SagB-type dehydrogenase family enzyme
MEVETPAGPVQMDFALRPYPAGGALHELEVYAVVTACPGLYRYEGLGHRLVCRAGRPAEVERLLQGAALAVGLQATEPQVLLVLAARLPWVAWKYAGLAYALVLKHIGVVFQTMYLAATAMGLAPCAVELGDSDLFAQATNADYYTESSVGEFLLGSATADEERQGAQG